MYGVVYLILNKINGRKYVGQTIQQLKVRFNEHAAKRNNAPLGKAIKKYGRENFYCGVIKTCASKAELDYWEKYYIAALKTKKPYGYNLTDGGEGTQGYHLTPEQRAKLSAKMSIVLLGNKHTLGYRHTPKSRAKMSATRKGKPKSPEWRAKIGAGNIGKKLTEESRAKIRAAHMGKPLSAEHRAKIAATEHGNNPFKNLLREIELRQLTYKALSKLIDMPLSSLSYKMQGVRKFTEGDKVKLEKFFGKPIEYLLARDDTKEF